MSSEVTRILHAIDQGDAHAADKLLPVVYQELRDLAARRLSQEAPGQTLQATALVHEVYIRLVGTENPNWENRGHFFAAAAEAMRRILIDKARRKKSLRHGGDRRRIDIEKTELAIEGPNDDLLALNEALTRLCESEPVVADIVKLRYFAGLTIEQAAQAKGVSTRTAVGYWAYARSWLLREINKGSTKT